jgi:signal transduction histidine kinase
VPNDDLRSRLAAHRTLGGAPREELAWLAAHGKLRSFPAGERVATTGESIDSLHVVLSGSYSIRVNRGTGPRKVMVWRAGDVSGILPYSRMSRAPGDLITEEPTEILELHRDHFPGLIRECHEATAILVHVMLDRTRDFTFNDLHVEKMVSLGTLAAGLAHELNNPASAVVRSAKGLAECLVEAEKTSLELGAARLADEQLAIIEELRSQCVGAAGRAARAALVQADREEAISQWLEEHGVALAVAQSLADSSVTLEGLDRAAALLDKATLDRGLRYIAANCSAAMLVADVEIAASRIHGLVAAVKGFTYMDQSDAPKPVDVGQGLADTVAVSRAKARSRNASVSLVVDPDLPAVEGFGGELNQVWANLIDNALDAVSDRGRVQVTAGREGPSVVVRVVDDGPGIPAEIQERIFEPFFTTKPVGRGTGLGLDVARRLVQRHEGMIDVESRPGCTQFRVTLPAAAPAEVSTRELALARDGQDTRSDTHAEASDPDR